MRKPRKNDTPTEKVTILRRHPIDRVPVSDLCDEYQLSPTLFHVWQELFFENGARASHRNADTTEQAHLRTADKLAGRDPVIFAERDRKLEAARERRRAARAANRASV